MCQNTAQNKNQTTNEKVHVLTASNNATLTSSPTAAAAGFSKDDSDSDNGNVYSQLLSNLLCKIVPWTIATYISSEFSLFLPRFQSLAGAKTFIHAGYTYDEDLTYFDNTILTYGTDYGITVVMTFAAIACLTAHSHISSTITSTITSTTSSTISIDPSQSKSLRIKSASLFFSYALSVLAGGYAHHTYTNGVDDLNTTSFRILWTICVGSVTAAGGFMGAIASDLHRRLNILEQERQQEQEHAEHSLKRFKLVHLDETLWTIYGTFLTVVCIMGRMSYTRPACDIFVAGTSQFVPTVYIVLVIVSFRWYDAAPYLEGHLLPSMKASSLSSSTSLSTSSVLKNNAGAMEETNLISNNQTTMTTTTSTTTSIYNSTIQAVQRGYRYVHYIGFFLNAPLLPSYPCFVQYTSLSLGVVNALLHMNLTFAWGMQAIALHHFCKAFSLVKGEVGVPVPVASASQEMKMMNKKDN